MLIGLLLSVPFSGFADIRKILRLACATTTWRRINIFPRKYNLVQQSSFPNATYCFFFSQFVGQESAHISVLSHAGCTETLNSSSFDLGCNLMSISQCGASDKEKKMHVADDETFRLLQLLICSGIGLSDSGKGIVSFLYVRFH